MDKCTTEQFWAVAVITGLCALVVTQKSSLVNAIPIWVILTTFVIIACYGVFYVLDRHMTYHRNAQDLVSLIQDFPDCPERMKRVPDPLKLRSFTGSAFYLLWICGATIVSFTILLCE